MQDADLVILSSKYLVGLLFHFGYHSENADSHQKHIHSLIVLIVNQYKCLNCMAKLQLCGHTANKNHVFLAFIFIFLICIK